MVYAVAGNLLVCNITINNPCHCATLVNYDENIHFLFCQCIYRESCACSIASATLNRTVPENRHNRIGIDAVTLHPAQSKLGIFDPGRVTVKCQLSLWFHPQTYKNKNKHTYDQDKGNDDIS